MRIPASVKSFLAAFALIVLQPLSSGPALAQSACNGMSVGQLTSLKGFVPFPADSLWNTDISTATVDPNSDNIINFIGASVTLHPDFGSGTYAGQSIGIPYQVVSRLTAESEYTYWGPMPTKAIMATCQFHTML